LQKSNDYVIISLHPKFSTKDWVPIEGELSNIYFSQGDMDKYPIMHKFDALITDYSSLAIDFLFMNKPVILFAYDLDTFTKEMGVYDELWSLMPGPKVSSFDELLKVITTDLQQFIPFIEVARNKIFAQIDTNASHRIAEEIQKLMSAKDNTMNCNNL
jgi:CDP-ribitol ribitolphosphotransferase